MSTYSFDKYNDLLNFLFEAKNAVDESNYEFDNWEVGYISVQAPLGMRLSLNTKIIDTGGEIQFQQWKKVKNILKTFLTQDLSPEFSNVGWYDRVSFAISSLDIRLICPKSVKDKIDIDSEFDSFRLSFIVDYGLIMASATSVEKYLPADSDIVEIWESYIEDVVNRWKVSKGK